MTAIPSPAEFLTAAYPDDEHEEPLTLDELVHDLERRVTALESGVAPGTVELVAAVAEPVDEAADYAFTLREQIADIEAKHDVVLQLVDEIRGIVKKSTSKVSLEVKAAIDAWANPQTPSPAPDASPSESAVDDAAAAGLSAQDVQQRAGEGSQTMGGFVGQPVHGADVEEWRAYARARGYQGVDVDTMNRSQIRTMLGIDHPAGA